MDVNEDKRPLVKLFTDGACICNPGAGGWAYILEHPASGRSKEGSGGEHATTNNRMEMMAVIRGLEALKAPSIVELYSDSIYVVNAITAWMARWKAHGWKKTARAQSQVKNADLWQRLDELMQPHRLTAHWIRGHVGHPENERCDQLATTAAEKIAATPAPPAPLAPPPPVVRPPAADLGLFAASPSEPEGEDE